MRGLARELDLSKPTVTRSLDTLCTLGYVERLRDTADLRNVFIVMTQEGMGFVETFGRSMGSTQ